MSDYENKKAAFLAKQAKAAKKLFKDKPQGYAEYFLPEDLRDDIRELIEHTSETQITVTHPVFMAYKQMQKRIDYLLAVKNHHRPMEAWRVDNDLTLPESIYCRHSDLQGHLNYVQTACSLLDITNTIDRTKNKTLAEQENIALVLRDWRKYMSDFPKKTLDIIFEMPTKPKFVPDDATRMLMEAQNKSRSQQTIQRLMNEVELRHNDGWFFIFDSLTLAPDMVKTFYETPTAIRDYARNMGFKVNEALGRKKHSSYTDVYRYFCVPEFGSLNGRLHFHVIHCVAALPLGSQDPNMGKRVRNNHVIDSCRGLWKFGFSAPIAVRYHNDAYTRSGWLLPVDKNGQAKQLKPIKAVCHYVAKYVNKNSDFKIRHKLKTGKSKWMRQIETIVPKDKMNHTFKVRMSRGFGRETPSMTNLSNASLMELTKLHWKVSPINKILKQNARKELALRLGALTMQDIQECRPTVINLLKSLRLSMQNKQPYNPANSGLTPTLSLTSKDISNETREYLSTVAIQHQQDRFQERIGTK